MESRRVLVTGGAGFIGSFIVDALVKKGHDVTVFDNLTGQVHGGKIPEFLNRNAAFVLGDVCDYAALKKAVLEHDVVFHEAAAVGIGQSMYEVRHYTDTNVMGTANLMHIVANEPHKLQKVIAAGSFSSYGEGTYSCESCGTVFPSLRSEAQLMAKQWELVCTCGRPLTSLPTTETKPFAPNSVYAVHKTVQEQLVLVTCKAYGVPAVSLRYFCVYGPRQSLSNPYTGVAAIFMCRIKIGRQPVVYEDGLQTRDFVSVHDIARANILAMESSAADFEALNIGSGKPTAIRGVAEILAKIYDGGGGGKVQPHITETFRKGDVRHCTADNSKAKRLLGYEPSVTFEHGMKELVEWSESKEVVDLFEKATSELKKKGLLE